ncbi:hypothetical protein D3C71_848280 [compost metagenome]
MKIKIECVGSNWGFYEIIDITSEFNDILNEDGKEAAEKYFAEGTYFEDSFNGTYSGSYIECLGQSDWCPPQIHYKEFKVMITWLDKQ